MFPTDLVFVSVELFVDIRMWVDAENEKRKKKIHNGN